MLALRRGGSRGRVCPRPRGKKGRGPGPGCSAAARPLGVSPGCAPARPGGLGHQLTPAPRSSAGAAAAQCESPAAAGGLGAARADLQRDTPRPGRGDAAPRSAAAAALAAVGLLRRRGRRGKGPRARRCLLPPSPPRGSLFAGSPGPALRSCQRRPQLPCAAPCSQPGALVCLCMCVWGGYVSMYVWGGTCVYMRGGKCAWGYVWVHIDVRAWGVFVGIGIWGCIHLGKCVGGVCMYLDIYVRGEVCMYMGCRCVGVHVGALMRGGCVCGHRYMGCMYVCLRVRGVCFWIRYTRIYPLYRCLWVYNIYTCVCVCTCVCMYIIGVYMYGGVCVYGGVFGCIYTGCLWVSIVVHVYGGCVCVYPCMWGCLCVYGAVFGCVCACLRGYTHGVCAGGCTCRGGHGRGLGRGRGRGGLLPPRASSPTKPGGAVRVRGGPSAPATGGSCPLRALGAGRGAGRGQHPPSPRCKRLGGGGRREGQAGSAPPALRGPPGPGAGGGGKRKGLAGVGR